MSSQATVYSVDALKHFRSSMALYGEETLAALGAVEAEVRRMIYWLEQERPGYWQQQIKRRRDLVSQARAAVHRKRLQQRPDYSPPMSEEMANLRSAEASLQDAEKRLTLVRKWQPRFQHAVLEYHASIQRLKDLAATDVPNAALLLGRIVDAIEEYLKVQPPSGTGFDPGSGRASSAMESIAMVAIDESARAREASERTAEETEPEAKADSEEVPA